MKTSYSLNMTQAQAYSILTKEWQSRQELLKIYHKKFDNQQNRHSFYANLRKLGHFAESMYRHKTYWYRLK